MGDEDLNIKIVDKQCNKHVLRGAFLTPEEVSITPTGKALKVEWKHEEPYLANTCTFIIHVGHRIKASWSAIATAVLFFRTYFRKKYMNPDQHLGRNTHSVRTTANRAMYDRHDVATACLFLARKVKDSLYNTPQLKKVILAAHRVKNSSSTQTLGGSEFQSKWKNILAIEWTLLDVIDYCFTVTNPFECLKDMLDRICKDRFNEQYNNTDQSWIDREIAGPGGVCHSAHLLVRDSLLSTACLQFSTHDIAVSVIWMAFHLAQIRVPRNTAVSDHIGGTWHMDLFSVSETRIEAIAGVVIAKTEKKNREKQKKDGKDKAKGDFKRQAAKR